MTTKYTKDHEWVRMEGEIAVIGITSHAAEQLGDVVFVELPDTGRTFATDEDMAVVESVKAASDVFAPIAGEVVAVNQDIVDSPEKVNEDANDSAWFVKMKPSDVAEVAALMDEAAYKEFIADA